MPGLVWHLVKAMIGKESDGSFSATENGDVVCEFGYQQIHSKNKYHNWERFEKRAGFSGERLDLYWISGDGQEIHSFTELHK